LPTFFIKNCISGDKTADFGGIDTCTNLVPLLPYKGNGFCQR
jgi:hypothetical protein